MNNSFNDPQPRWYAEIAYEQIKQQINPDNDPQIKAQWLLDNSHNQQTYLEIFPSRRMAREAKNITPWHLAMCFSSQ